MSRVLVTGCSSGIGRSAVALLRQNGHEVVATARDVSALADLDADLRLPLDVRDQESVAAAFAESGALDAVVCNAGISLWAPLDIADMADIEAVIDTNLLGAVRVVKAALPGFRKRRSGRIVVVSSTAARRVTPFIGVYAASKVALEAIVESVRYECAAFGVTAAIVEPGAIVTSMDRNRRVLAGEGSEYAELVARVRARVADVHASALPVEEAGRYVLAAVEDPEPPLRMPVGESATARIGERLSLSDSAYEKEVLRDLLGLDPVHPVLR
jgi:NADP-dependent 3-hydroxy acid dehydrogenase YdfG